MVFTGVAWHRQGFYGRPGGATHLRSGTATDGGGRGEGRRLRHQQGCAQQRTARQCIAKARPAEAKRAGASCLRRRRERRACRRRGCALDGKSGGREKRGFLPALHDSQVRRRAAQWLTWPLAQPSTIPRAAFLNPSSAPPLCAMPPSTHPILAVKRAVELAARVQKNSFPGLLPHAQPTRPDENADRRVALWSRRPTGGR